jgi:hypothetical protein
MMVILFAALWSSAIQLPRDMGIIMIGHALCDWLNLCAYPKQVEVYKWRHEYDK